MKYSILGFVFLFFFAAIPSIAQDQAPVNGNLKALRNPIKLDYGNSPLMNVVFNHTSHKGIKCRLCHHMANDNGQIYIPCTNEDCHSLKGARERDPMSMFMAYHAPDTDRSCYGCHKMEAKKYPQFVGCRPCHMSPMAKQEMAGK